MLIREIRPQTVVSGRYLVIEAQLRTAKNGSGFVALRLGDKTGEISGKIWDADERVFAGISAGRVMEVTKLSAREFAGSLQLEMDARHPAWRMLAEEEVDFADYLPVAPTPREELWRRLGALIDSIKEPHLGALLRSFFADERFRAVFSMVPAALKRHHVYVGGLLEHTTGVAALCEAAARQYPAADRDLLLSGALLHDLGKTASYKVGRSFEGTDEGKLLGHLVMGVQMVAERIERMRLEAGSPEKGFPEELRLCLQHMLVSHHGIMEWGSPVEPVSLEACLLHHADNMDAQATKYLQALRDHQPAAGRWTSYDSSIGRSIYAGMSISAKEDQAEGAGDS